MEARTLLLTSSPPSLRGGIPVKHRSLTQPPTLVRTAGFSRPRFPVLRAQFNADSLNTHEKDLQTFGTYVEHTEADIQTVPSTPGIREQSEECSTSSEPTFPERFTPRRYRNKFIGLVKLSSTINDAAEAFFQSEGRRRVFITVALLMLCRAGQFVPLPGFDQKAIPDFGGATLSDSGGSSFEPKLSFFQLGLGPYICASTVMQLLCAWYPPFQKLRKDGEIEKLKSHTWWLSLVCAVVQSFILTVATFQYSPSAAAKPWKHLLYTSGLLTLGSICVEWISGTITESGFGQGSTLIICMGILVSCSQSLQSMVSSFASSSISHWGKASGLFVAVFLAMTMCAVLVTEGRRTIKLQFYGFDRFPSTGSYGGAISEVEPYIPFDINPGGMLPVLMSSYLLALPAFLARFINAKVLVRLSEILNPSLPAAPGAKPLLYHGLNAAFIFLFSVLEINDGAKEISEYINRIGARIHDVKPGRSTIEFLRKVQNSARSWGGILLALLVTLSTVVDYKLRSVHQTRGSVSFTSMLFIVGTIIEVRRSFMAYHALHTLSKVLQRYGV